MKKQIIIILAIICVIILGIVVAINVNNDETEEVASQNAEHNKTENKVENKIENNADNKEENKLNETESENINVEDTTEGKDIKEEKTKTDLEKAIDIVKEDWGEDETVKFAEDGTTANGEYIICVRDKKTTNALAWYTVDAKTGEFEKE